MRILRRVMAAAALAAALLPAAAGAEGLRGFLELGYVTSDTQSTDAGNVTTSTKSSSILQRYNLSLDRMLYPTLRFTGGGTVDYTMTSAELNDTQLDTTLLKVSPFLDLTLGTPLYSAGLGYNRRQEIADTEGVGSSNIIHENYNAKLSLRPEGLPSLEFLYTRTNSYDSERAFQDVVLNSYNLGSRYKPVDQLELNYQGLYTDATDNLTRNNATVLTHTGRVTYNDQFWQDRVTLYANYNISSQETNSALFRLFPTAGLSALTDTPLLVTLAANPALVDGNLNTGSAVNIGIQPVGGDIRPRNLGFDFGGAVSVNRIRVWLNTDLPPDIDNRFSWTIYTSSDNLNWTLVQLLPTAPFRSNEAGTGWFYELSFSGATSRYLKVVTSPLPLGTVSSRDPTANLTDIQVTELEAFVQFEEVQRRTTTQLSHVLDTNMRVRILENPNLNYELSYYYDRSDSDFISTSRYILSNGLSASHRFNQYLSASARFAREDSKENQGARVSYIYSTLLTATPLPTLMHSLVFSGRNEEVAGRKSDTNSLFLNNSATLYRGVDVNLNGGYSMATAESGQKTNTTIITFGLTLLPHSTLTVNVSYSGNMTDQTGGGLPDNSTFTHRGDLSAAFNPLRSVYLFGAFGVIMEKNKDMVTTRNIGGTWSPFRDGALQLSFSYNEAYNSSANQKDRTIVPSLRWNIRGGSYLDVSYLYLKSTSVSQSSDSRTFSSTLRFAF
ncbi:hypothetical protein [Geobacter anodireducens]|uniref:F5/8 type C domain-containing protein n=1 Tax=Geobacter anodireducens TaxID=1340425 RepID=A0ABR9NT69_9BACT|nr:hypothetical protein [Geobacter anodireducens]ANA41599.1 hypothetical protein A2G06_05100 [Geobacter anodireducens]MBE2887454.1 hypothetical protein [Geobacter anodireducens]